MRSLNKAKNWFSLNKQLVKFQFSKESNAGQNFQVDRFSMTPHEYYITQGKAMERPFTGKTWYVKDVGDYHCKCCGTKLFSFDQKFQSNNGMANFWNFQEGAVRVVDIEESDVNCKENRVNLSLIDSELNEEKDKKRVECTDCGTHLGLAYFDGPPPTFMRYTINAASAEFRLKPNWEDPNIEIQKKKDQKFEEYKKRKEDY